ncbi:hypothetical protein AGMMS49545_21720 [Betaproteobacteria bacterium]|nr:hypothetical protein AGMMS49545_21720 [Betaproteobacteria bacterium]
MSAIARLTSRDWTLARYERRQADGTIETYAHSDNKTVWPRRFFLTERKDPAGNRLRFHYDAKNRLIAVEDATGQKTTLEYKHADPLKITALVDPHGRRAQIAYDDKGRLIAITDAIGMTSRVGYSGRGTFIERMETPYGVTRFASGSGWQNRWIEITDPLGRTERVEARDGAAGIPDAETNAPNAAGITNSGLSRHNTFYWDAVTYAKHKGDYSKAKILHWRDEDGMAVGVLSSVKEPLENRLWYAYDPKAKTAGTCKNPVGIARTLPDGGAQQNRYQWNAWGNTLMSRDPLGRETRVDYAPNGIDMTSVRQKTDQGWDTLLQVTWNTQHRPLKVKDAAGRSARFVWNAVGQLTSRTDDAGETTQYQYNASGRLLKIITPTGRPGRVYTWDARGNLASETDSEGYTLKYEYDPFDRITKITYPDGTTTETTWDKLDPVMLKDRNGQKKRYQYDAARQLIAVQDALRTIRFGYDAAGRLTRLIDGKGNTTQWQRDIQGRVLAKITPDGAKTVFEYDSAGRLAKRTDALGQTTVARYDIDNRVNAIAYTNVRTPTAPISLKWDAAYPRLKEMKDSLGATRYSYGKVGQPGALRLIEETPPASDAAYRLQYDTAGRLRAWQIGTATETLEYDPLGRVTKKQNSLGEFDYAYLGDTGQLESARLASALIEHRYRYEQNAGDRKLKEILNPKNARDFEYQTAPESLIASITEKDQNKTRKWTYQYDALGRLERAQDGKQTYRYVLDAANNLSAIETPEGKRAYTSGTDNRITQAPYKFDANGNRTEDETRTYQWDAENRLMAIGYKKAPGKRTEFQYDGQDRRVAIIETDGKARTETKYTWCGNTVCRTKSGANEAYYFGEGAYRVRGKKRDYYAKDHLGSVRDILDEKGAVAARYDYDPYGQLTNNPTTKPEFGYAGMQYHAPSGLYLTKYRAYDPKDGRWLSKDPIEEAGGLNLYGYVEGNPVNWIDPLGLWVEGTYNLTTNILTLRDREKGTTISGTFISGGAPYGDPIPVGTYDILIRQGRSGFFRLESLDENYGDDMHEKTGRTLLRLHHPGNSIGCITATDWDNWNEIEALINATQTDSVNIVANRRWYQGWKSPGWHEKLTRYGRITVIQGD